MSEFPPDWHQVRIGNLLTEHSDRSTSSNQHEVLSVTKDGIFSQREYFKKQIASEDNTGYKVVKRGDVVFSAMNLWMGSIDVVKEYDCGIVSPAYITMRPRSELIDADFLSYLLRGEAMRKKYVQHSQQGASIVRRNLNKDDLLDDEVAIPPLPEQKKIAEILSGIDRCISAFTSQVNKFEIAKSALSSELISGLSESRKKSAYGLIPCHWSESTLGEVLGTANLQTGPFGSQLHAHEYTAEGIPVVMPQDMKNCVVVTSKIARIPPERAESLDKHKVVPGDILFSRRGEIGRHAVVGINESGWICGTGCLRARTEEKINAFFLSELLSHRFALEWLNANAVGQTMLNLNTGILSELPIIVPPMKEQEKIADSLGSINHMTEQISNQIALAQKLKIAISTDLLSGRKRVSI